MLRHFTLHCSSSFFGHLLLVDTLDDGDVANGFAIYSYGGEEKLIGTVAELGLFAIDHGVGESIHVSRCLPYLRVHDDGRIEALYVVAALHKVAPPSLLNIVTQLDSEGPVVIEAVVAAVDFGGLKNKTAALTQADDVFH